MRNRWWALPMAAASTALIAACGSSATTGSGSTSGSGSGSGTGTAPQSAPAPGPHAPPASHAPQGAGVPIMTEKVGGGTVLANAQGRTIYWFAIDKPMTSKCYGSCAAFWPPVIGHPVAARGASLPKGFGTITRTDGQVQATYDGHPLYTYMGDSKARQDTGNAKNLSGGLWWAMTPSGSKLGASGGSGGSGGPASGGGMY